MDLLDLKGRLLSWSDEKAWKSDKPICSNTLNLIRFHGESAFCSDYFLQEGGGLFSSNVIASSDSQYADILNMDLHEGDLLGIAYYLSRYKGSLRDYALNRLCLRHPALNDYRDEIANIIESPREHWLSNDSTSGRFLYNDVSVAFGDLEEMPCFLGGSWSPLMLRIPDYQVSFRSDNRIGNLVKSVMELSSSPLNDHEYIEYAFCGEAQNIAAEILLDGDEIIYGTQIRMHAVRRYVLNENNKSRFLDQLLSYPDSWMFPISDSSVLSDELLEERLSHLFVSTYLSQPVYHRSDFLERYADTALVETAGSVQDLYRCIRRIQPNPGSWFPPGAEQHESDLGYQEPCDKTESNDADLSSQSCNEVSDQEVISSQRQALIRASFCCISGWSLQMEKSMWQSGIFDIHSLLEKDVRNSDPDLGIFMVEVLENNTRAIELRLPQSQKWRLISASQNIGYLDIETTGLSRQSDSITTVSLLDETGISTYVRGENLHCLKQAIQDCDLIITYNGRAFDLPFLQSSLDIVLDLPDLDLRYELADLGFKGGQKQCEASLGLDRAVEDKRIDGRLAIRLWEYYENHHDPEALETLLAYNVEDVLRLKMLAQVVFNKKLALLSNGIQNWPIEPQLSNPHRVSRRILDMLL